MKAARIQMIAADATPAQNADLYWALSGGGAGTFAAVLSVTVRVFPSRVTSNAAFSFSVSQAGGVAPYWRAVSVFHHQIKPLLDEGLVVEYGFSNQTLSVTGTMVHGPTVQWLRSRLQPLLGALKAETSSNLTEEVLGIRLAQANDYYSLYQSEIESLLADLRFVPAIAVPRHIMNGNTTQLDQAYRTIVDRGYFFAVIALNAMNSVRNNTAPAIAPNAIQPDFNNAYSSIMINAPWLNTLPWSDAQKVQHELMEQMIPVFDHAAPGAGAYKNEANWAEKDIAKTFYGNTYTKLEGIKKKYDFGDLFYGSTAVGYDRFEFDTEGRLCRI